VQVLNATLARASARYAGDSGLWCAECVTADGRYLKEGGRSAGDLVHKEGQLLSTVQVLNATLARASTRYAGDSGLWCAECVTADGRYLKEGAPCCTMAHGCNDNCLLMCVAGRQLLSQSNPCP
jgi:hypothetical protein